MTQCKFVGLSCKNPNWDQLGKLIQEHYPEHVNIPKCTEQGWNKLFEVDPHITLIYNEDIPKGLNWMYWFCTIKHRDIYNQLKENIDFTFDNLVIDTFDNEDARVLKINVKKSVCSCIDVLEDYHEVLAEKFGTKYSKYQPHITITYLRPDTPDSVIEEIKSKILKTNYLRFKFGHIMLGGGEEENYCNQNLPIL